MSSTGDQSEGHARLHEEPRSFLDAFTAHSETPSTFPFFYTRSSSPVVSPPSSSTETFPLLSDLLSQTRSHPSLTVSRRDTATSSSTSRRPSSFDFSHPPPVNPPSSVLQHFSLAFAPPSDPNSSSSTRILFDIASSTNFCPIDVQSQLKSAISG